MRARGWCLQSSRRADARALPHRLTRKAGYVFRASFERSPWTSPTKARSPKGRTSRRNRRSRDQARTRAGLGRQPAGGAAARAARERRTFRRARRPPQRRERAARHSARTSGADRRRGARALRHVRSCAFTGRTPPPVRRHDRLCRDGARPPRLSVRAGHAARPCAIAESENVDVISRAVADYIARRLIEREKALAADALFGLPVAPARPAAAVAAAAQRPSPPSVAAEPTPEEVSGPRNARGRTWRKRAAEGAPAAIPGPRFPVPCRSSRLRGFLCAARRRRVVAVEPFRALTRLYSAIGPRSPIVLRSSIRPRACAETATPSCFLSIRNRL